MGLIIENGDLGSTARDKINKLFPSFNPEADSYTLVLADAFKVMQMNKATALNLTVPPNSSVPFEIGTIITVVRTGAGQLTFVQGSGVTITASAVVLTDPGLNIYMTLIKTGTDTWDLQNGATGAYIAFTPGFTGFSANPTAVDARYYQNGKFVHIIISMTAGTSNATGFTITGLPVAPRTNQNCISLLTSNSATLVGRVDIAAGATVASMTSGTGGALSATGSKACFMNICFEAQ